MSDRESGHGVGSSLFSGGPNIAMKVPPQKLDAVVKFYRDVIGLQVSRSESGWMVEFGAATLWLDPSDRHVSEIWLELVTDDLENAEQRLRQAGVQPDETIESLPSGYPGFWISNPIGCVHLVSKRGA